MWKWVNKESLEWFPSVPIWLGSDFNWVCGSGSGSKKAKITHKIIIKNIEIIWYDGLVGILSGVRKFCIMGLEQRGQYILFSVVFTPSPPQPAPRQCLDPYLSPLSSTVALYRRCGIALSYAGRGVVRPKTKTIVGLLVFNHRWLTRHKFQFFIIKTHFSLKIYLFGN